MCTRAEVHQEILASEERMQNQMVDLITQSHAGYAKTVSELGQQLADIKRGAFRILVSGIVVAALYGIWVGTMQFSLSDTRARGMDTQADVESLEKRQNDSDILAAEIRTKLANIEATLLEIKKSL